MPQLINIPNIKHPVVIRQDLDDVSILKEVFESGVYELARDVMFPPAMKSFAPKFIIDGGAHVGCASVFFANRYPSAEKILSIEPAVENLELLRYNTQNYSQIEVIQSALWGRETVLEVSDEYHAYCGFTMKEPNSASLPQKSTRGITIGKIFRESGFDFIDILKLDVEGAEKEIFSDEGNYQEWLPYVKVLIIELHDRMKRDCSHNFFRAISWYKSYFAFSGENLIFIREDLL